MTESPPSPRDAAAPLPALVSLGLLLALAIGVGVFAFARPAAAPEAKARANASVESGLVEDVLTGRTTDANGRPVPPTEGLGSPGQPLRLRFVPSAEQTEALATIERLVSWLQERTGYAIEGRILNSYGLVIEELVQGRCDVAFLTAASYARARFATDGNDDPDDDIVAFLGAVRHGAPEYPGSDLAYRAALLVKNDSPIQGLDDLKDGVRVAMGSPTSGASSILPSALFQRRGIKHEIRPVISSVGTHQIGVDRDTGLNRVHVDIGLRIDHLIIVIPVQRAGVFDVHPQRAVGVRLCGRERDFVDAHARGVVSVEHLSRRVRGGVEVRPVFAQRDGHSPGQSRHRGYTVGVNQFEHNHGR